MTSFKDLENSENIAELLTDKELAKISAQVLNGFSVDENSISEWRDTAEEIMKLAKQTMETKNTPFPNAANVKYPLIAQSAIDFASRTYPQIVQGNKAMYFKVVGPDGDNEKLKRATRLETFHEYQLVQESEAWVEGMDRMLHILPLLGVVFKKTYYNPVEQRTVSEVCSPEKIVVNYNVRTLDQARRITHIITAFSNDIVERIRLGVYRDIDVDKLKASEGFEGDEEDEDRPLSLLEQHCYLDLDKDGYAEPYIVVIHKQTGEVLRIVQRFDEVKRKDGQLLRITPVHYFTDYHCIRSPDGGFYSIGLGTLLLPINHAINSIMNQLLDAGTLNNNQSGFLGRGLRLKTGDLRLRLGEWKVLDAATGTNIAQNVVPLPTKEPSPTLFQLLGMLVTVGKDLASANDIMQGKGQTQNVPATTVLTLLDQGMKVFTAINKRIYLSMRSEFRKIFKTNAKHLPNALYRKILDDVDINVKADFDMEGIDVLPVADPQMSTQTQRLAKAQTLLSIPGVNVPEATKYFMETLQLDEELIARLLPEPDPNAPPPPDTMKIMAEIEKINAETQKVLVQMQLAAGNAQQDAEKLNIQRDDALVRAQESLARIQKMSQDAALTQKRLDLADAKAGSDASLSERRADFDEAIKEAQLVVDVAKVIGKDVPNTRVDENE